MKFDNIIEFVRVRIFNRKPITLERKRDEAILKETLNYRYGQNPGLLSTLRLKIKRWNLKKEEKYDIIDKLLQQVRRNWSCWDDIADADVLHRIRGTVNIGIRLAPMLQKPSLFRSIPYQVCKSSYEYLQDICSEFRVEE
jgi:hypothetical protein